MSYSYNQQKIVRWSWHSNLGLQRVLVSEQNQERGNGEQDQGAHRARALGQHHRTGPQWARLPLLPGREHSSPASPGRGRAGPSRRPQRSVSGALWAILAMRLLPSAPLSASPAKPKVWARVSARAQLAPGAHRQQKRKTGGLYVSDIGVQTASRDSGCGGSALPPQDAGPLRCARLTAAAPPLHRGRALSWRCLPNRGDSWEAEIMTNAYRWGKLPCLQT